MPFFAKGRETYGNADGMPTHRMHLKGPWEYEVQMDSPSPASQPKPALSPKAAVEPLKVSATGTIRMPSTWEAAFGDYRGAIRFQRRFQKPTNLDPEERVFVVFDGIGGTARVTLNDQELGEIRSE